MSVISSRGWAALAATAILLSLAVPAKAQLFRPNPCQSCAAPVAQVAHVPQVSQTICRPVQQQVCYRTVPVTEYQKVTQVVKKPVYETKYVDQQVTEYKTVNEQRTVDVPTVNYQQVTEMQTRYQDRGCWQSYCQSTGKVAPCQYDNRPSLLGWMNRTGYAMRTAFTPQYKIQRQYVPNVVAQQVPVTRQVAVRGTQKMTYNVAKLVPVTKTQKVAVRTVRWEDETVTVNRPVTAYRTVPIGTQTAFGFVPFAPSSTTTAEGPSPDPISIKKAEGDDKKKSAAKNTDKRTGAVTPKKSSSRPLPPGYRTIPATIANTTPASTDGQPLVGSNTTPSIVRLTGWRARIKPAGLPEPPEPPAGPEVNLANNQP